MQSSLRYWMRNRTPWDLNIELWKKRQTRNERGYVRLLSINLSSGHHLVASLLYKQISPNTSSILSVPTIADYVAMGTHKHTPAPIDRGQR